MTKKEDGLPWDWMQIPMPHQSGFADKWENRTLADFALERADTSPDAPYFANVEGDATHAGLWEAAQALSVSMHEMGLRPGDVISFQVPNWIEAAVLNLSAAMSGLIVNPIVPIYRDAEVKLMLSDCRAKAFFLSAEFRRYDFAEMAHRIAADLPDLQHIVLIRPGAKNGTDFENLIANGRGKDFDRPNVDPSGVKMALYTSGTTGRPKAVLHSHNTLTRIMRESAAHWGVQDGDAIIMPSPVTHVSGYANGLEMPFVAGTCSVLMEAWNATEALDLIEKYQAVGTVAATPFLTELATEARKAGKRLPSFRYFACGGAAVPDEVIPAANAAFENCRAFRVFGASEVPLVTFGWPADKDEELAATTDGQVVDYEVRIVDDEDRDVPTGQEGEILARGPAMMLGYGDEQQTRASITDDGYFRTGDLGVLDANGAITITGRKKDLIIRGGENISAKEIEDVLHTNDSIVEATVVAMPHERLGEGVCAYLILTEGAKADPAIYAGHVLNSGLAKQKIPERFEFVTDFPRTASGKIRKDKLREDIRERMTASAD